MKESRQELYYMEGHSVPLTPAPGEKAAPWEKTHVIGAPRPRVDGYERVSGSAVFPSDTLLPNMLYGAILGTPHPNCIVKKVDISAAQKIPGVRAIITGNSPEADIIWPYKDDYKPKLFDSRCRYEGEPVAAVAADTPYLAKDALDAIVVEYEVLDFVSDERKALESGAPKVHPDGNTVKTDTYKRGDIETGFSQADVVLEQSYRTACQIHTPMELHGCVAKWDKDRLTLWESTQGVYKIQEEAARILNLPLSKVRVIGHYMGGGFGSKLQPGKYTIIASVLAKMTAAPVKLFLSREQTYLTVGNRPPTNMTVKAGVKKDGTLTALSFTCTGASGAYPAGGTSLVDFQARDLYKCPNVQCKSTDIFINAGPARAFRAPGHPQGAFALEQMMDALAEALEMDPVEFRSKNLADRSQAMEGAPPYSNSGFKECLLEGARAFKWDKAKKDARSARAKSHIQRGVGMAGSLWIAGGGWPPSTVVIKLFSDGSVNLNMGASDIGTGTKTIMAMVISEELGIKPEMIQIEHADTGTTQYASSSGGSKTVPTEAPAVREACWEVKRELLKMAAEELKTSSEGLRFEDGQIISKADTDKKIGIMELKNLKTQGVILGVGHRGPNPPDMAIRTFSAQFCEVEVNTATGEISILRFLGTNDSGRVMNRLTYDSQVFGGITMGIGLGLTEERILDRRVGKLVTKNWHDYKLPTSLDVPSDMVSVPIDIPDNDANSTGAKGLGEPVTIPTAAAIANAIYDATGIRFTESPITPMKIRQMIADSRKEG